MIKTKDLVYWIIILVMINLTILTSKFGGNEKIVSYISFAGTITSILLAVIAIIYSFFQNFTNLNSNEKLVNSAEKIESLTKKIDESIDAFATANMEICKRFEGCTKELEESVSEKFESTHGQISKITEQLSKMEVLNKENIKSEDYTNFSGKNIDELLDTTSYLGIMVLYACYISYIYDVSFEFKEFAKEIFKTSSEYTYGYFIAMNSCGLIGSYEDDNKMRNITYYNELLLDKIANEAEKRDDYKSKSQKKNIEEYFKKIKEIKENQIPEA